MAETFCRAKLANLAAVDVGGGLCLYVSAMTNDLYLTPVGGLSDGKETQWPLPSQEAVRRAKRYVAECSPAAGTYFNPNATYAQHIGEPDCELHR